MSITKLRKQLGIDKIVSDKYYKHDQGQASDVWECHHNFGRVPTVNVIDTANEEIEGSSTHSDDLLITWIQFNVPVSGYAYFT